MCASPLFTVTTAQSALDGAVAKYDAARAHLSTIEDSVARQTAELDANIARQDELQAALGQRARYLYRSGPLAFVEVLLSSADLGDFLVRWDALVRLSREDARMISELETTRTRLAGIVAHLLSQQADASRGLRALEAAKADASRELANSKAALDEYRKRIAAREAAAAASAAAAEAATTRRASPASTTTPPRASGSTASWRAAVASWYGTGSYGLHLASGFTIGPDSMIVAHKTLPFGTLVEFSYRGHTGIATVADRGPYVAGRTWDLGPGIAHVLGFEGVATVRYRVLGL